MDCRETEKLLTLYIDGEISRADARELDAHVRQCRRCTALFEEAMEIKDIVRRIPMEKAPEDLRRKIALQIADSGRRTTVTLWLGRAAAAAVLALAVYGGYAWFFPRTVVRSEAPMQPGAPVVAQQDALQPGTVRPVSAAPNRMGKFPGMDIARLKKRTLPPNELENLVVEHVRPLPAEIQTPDVDSVARWYASKSGFYAPPPQLVSWGGRMEGGRMTRFQGHEAVQLFYNVGGKRVTVFMFRPDNLDDVAQLDTLEQLGRTDEEDYISSTPGGRMVALFSHNGIGYSVITDSDRELMRRAVHAVVSQSF